MRINFFMLMLFPLSLFSQSPKWVWAKWSGGMQNEYPIDIKTTPAGESYVVGSLKDTLLIPPFSLMPVDTAYSDSYIAKYDANGNCMWFTKSYGMGWDYANAVSIDQYGNAYVLGSFSDTVIWGGNTFVSNGLGNFYITKIDPSGNVLWTKQDGGAQWANAISISNDTASAGNFYVAGTFYDSIIIGGISLTSYKDSTYAFFVACYDSLLNTLWAVSVGQSNWANLSASATDANGNTYLQGHFQDTLFFPSDTLTSLPAYTDIFVAKCNSNGNFTWVRGFGGPQGESARGVCTDNAGSVYCTGRFTDSVYFGTYALQTYGISDAFIAKYDAAGNEKWIIRLGGPVDDQGMDIACDRQTDVYVCGYYRDWILFSEEPIPPVPAIEYTDLFVAKYDSSGNLKWWKVAGGLGWENPYGISVDAQGHAYIIGSFDSTCVFDTINLVNYFAYDGIVAKLDNVISNNTNEYQFENFLSLFPNPSSGIFIIQTKGEIKNIEVINVLGEKVYWAHDAHLLNHTSTIDLSSQPDGIYFLRLQTDKGIFSRKIIIAR